METLSGAAMPSPTGALSGAEGDAMNRVFTEATEIRSQALSHSLPL